MFQAAARTIGPELPQDQTQIVTGATEHHIHLVAFGAFQVISTRYSIRFQMADHRLNSLAPLQRSLQLLRSNTAFLTRDVHRCFFCAVATVVAINKHFVNHAAG